jgi:hypothetical protein
VTLSTFSSRALGTALIFILFLGLEFNFRKNSKYFDPKISEMKTKIEEARGKKLDLILVGNSMLGANLDAELFTVELSELIGRPIQILNLNISSISMPFFYLLTKNFLVKKEFEKIPIFYISHTRKSYLATVPNSPELNLIREISAINDPIFSKKAPQISASPADFVANHCVQCVKSPKLNHHRINYLIRPFYDFANNGTTSLKIQDILKNTLGDFNTRDENENIESEPMGYGKTIHKRIEQSLISDLTKLLPRNEIIFVFSHPNFGYVKANEISVSFEGKRTAAISNIAEFSSALKDYGIKTINFNVVRELDPFDLYIDTCHLKPEGRFIFSKILAKQIFSLGLIQR